MNRWFLTINLFNILVISSGQNWAGSYRWQSSCDQANCCCGVGTLNITQVSSTVLGVIAGANSRCPVPVIYENLMNATSYTINQQQSFGTVVWTLSSDSKSLTLTSSAWSSSCNDGAVKNTALRSIPFLEFGSVLAIGSIWMTLIHINAVCC